MSFKGILKFSLAIIIVICSFSVSTVSLGANVNIVSNTKTIDETIKAGELDIPAGLPLPQQQGITQNTTQENIANYEVVASNKDITLFADMSKGWVALRNNISGYIWYSHPDDEQLDKSTTGTIRQQLRSDVVIQYVLNDNKSNTSAINEACSQVECVRKKLIKVDQISNGIRVTYDFFSCGIRIPVEYYIDGSVFRAKILCNEILYYDDYIKDMKSKGYDADQLNQIKNSTLLNIWLLPSFGACSAQKTGYLFIPDGSGALAYFNNGIKMQTTYNKLVYGDELALDKQEKTSNTMDVKLPVFGVACGNDSLMGIITQGDGAASIKAFTSNANCYYNSVSSVANLGLVGETTLYKDNPTNTSQVMKVSNVPNKMNTYEVSYYCLNGDNSSYVGMAKQYQKYLTDEKGLIKKTFTPSLSLNIYGAIDKKASFLGIPYDKIVSLTTFSEAKEILNYFKQSGVDNISVRYMGWNNNGIMNNKVINKAVPLSELGGKSEFNELVDYMKTNNYCLYPDVDLLRYRSSGNGISKTVDSTKNAFGQTTMQYKYLPSVFVTSLSVAPYRLLTPQKIKNVADRYLPSYEDLKLNSVSLSTASYLYYSNLDDKKGFYRSYLENEYLDVFNSYSKNNMIAFENANAYAIPYAQRIYNTPMSSSNYDFFDEDVPFYQIVTHGYLENTTPAMNYSYDKESSFLKAVETGSELCYDAIYNNASVLKDTDYNDLYSTTYTLWSEDAIKQYQSYKSLLSKIYDQTIVDHKKVADGVYYTKYSNDISVMVNYNESQYVLDNEQTIAPKSFIEVRGK